jgi:hypothetical protein
LPADLFRKKAAIHLAAALSFLLWMTSADKLLLKALEQLQYVFPDLGIGIPVQIEKRKFILIKQKKLLLWRDS